MLTVQVSELRSYGLTDLVISAQVLGVMDGTKDGMQFFVGVTHGNAVPIGMLTTYRDVELRSWKSFQLAVVSLERYLGRPAATATLIDTRANTHAYVDFFVKLHELDVPMPDNHPCEAGRVALLDNIRTARIAEAGHTSDP